MVEDADNPNTPHEDTVIPLPSDLEARVYEIWLDGDASERTAALDALLADYPKHGKALRLLCKRLTTSDDVLGKVQTGVAPATPERIGPYEILEEVGAGGFGVVYRAKQHDPVQRTVAIKLLLAGRMHGANLIRFENERQTLALMEHPAIAHVFDAGATREGQPYFVMEFVEGAPITEYCDVHRLDIQSRLGLFGQVCAAVHHAHQKGVVHRDIKPANVLVCKQDGRATPKIIDFGVAKVMFGTAARQSYATLEGGLVGTPEYMSPEQASSKPIDTRTDVYALGVLLYELLTGELPYERDRLQTGSLIDVARIICDEEPRRPSNALTRPSVEVSMVAASRDTNPQRLLRSLRADLDWVVLKALQKDPAARYDSAATLSEDVDRYCRYLPVEARQPVFFYTARKFVRRHRVGVAVAMFVILTSALAVSGLIWALFEVDAAREEAVGNGREATRRGEEATAQRNRAVLNAYAANLSAARLALDAGAVADAERRLKDTPAHLRGWEWRYLNAICDQSAIRMDLKMGRLLQLAWLSDTQLIVSTIDRQGIHVWDLTTRSVVRSFDGFDAFDAIMALTPDRRWLVTGSSRGIERWNVASGRLSAVLAPCPHSPFMALSPEGDRLAWSERGAQVVKLLEVSGERQPREVWSSDVGIWGLGFSPDGKSLLVSTWEAETAMITVVDIASGTAGRTFEVDTLPLAIMEFDVTGKRLFTGGVSSLLRVWDFASGKLLREFPCPDRIGRFVQTADGRRAYATGGYYVGWVASWDMEKLERIGEFSGHRLAVSGLGLAPDGKRFATASRDGTVRIWPSAAPPRFVELSTGSPMRQLTQSHDGKRMATASTRGEWKVWSVDTLEVIGQGDTEHLFNGCAVQGDVICVFGEVLRGYDIKTGEELFAMECSGDSLRDVVFEPDGKLTGRTFHNRLVHFEPGTDKEGRFVDAPFEVTALRLGHSAASTLVTCLIAGCKDGIVRFLQPGTLEVIGEFAATPGIQIDEVAQHGGRLAVSGPNGTVRVFDMVGEAPPLICQGPEGRFMTLVFSPDGHRLVTGVANKTVQIWDLQTGTELLALETSTTANEVCFSNDGRKLFVRSQRWRESETTILVFEAPAK